MRISGHESRELFHEWFESVDLGFLHYFDGELVGHTSYLNHRPADRSVEIGNTWVTPAAWGTGANTEAKFLLLRHAFESEGCLRVEFKTDARTAARAPRSPRCPRLRGRAPQAHARPRRRAPRLRVVRSARRRVAAGEGDLLPG